MDIKSKVIEILSKENYTFTQLADYLHMTEEGLTMELTNKTLELRNLEAISKALRVPLYSFFRTEGINLILQKNLFILISFGQATMTPKPHRSLIWRYNSSNKLSPLKKSN